MAFLDRVLDLFYIWYQGMTPDQWALTALSLTGAWLVTDHRAPVQRWGPVFGLASQPFWLYTAWVTSASGVFVMSCLYTFIWARGVFNGFVRRPVQ